MEITEKRKKVRMIALLLIGVNLSLFLIKWVPTFFYQSISVKADAFNSLGDLAYSGFLFLGFEILLRPKDDSHPHGHERFEPFISLVVAIAIGITGVLIVKQAIESIFNPVYKFSIFLIIALIISAITKFGLSVFLKKKGKELGSTALISSSEDSKTDVLASFTALVGVIGAGGGLLFLDTFVGLIVSVWIFKTAYSIGKKNFKFLTGGAAPEKIVDRIRKILDEKKEVISYHDLEAHYVGPEIHVSLNIHLSDKLDFYTVHDIEEDLKKEIGSLSEVDAVYLHLEPENDS